MGESTKGGGIQYLLPTMIVPKLGTFHADTLYCTLAHVGGGGLIDAKADGCRRRQR